MASSTVRDALDVVVVGDEFRDVKQAVNNSLVGAPELRCRLTSSDPSGAAGERRKKGSRRVDVVAKTDGSYVVRRAQKIILRLVEDDCTKASNYSSVFLWLTHCRDSSSSFALDEPIVSCRKMKHANPDPSRRGRVMQVLLPDAQVSYEVDSTGHHLARVCPVPDSGAVPLAFHCVGSEETKASDADAATCGDKRWKLHVRATTAAEAGEDVVLLQVKEDPREAKKDVGGEEGTLDEETASRLRAMSGRLASLGGDKRRKVIGIWESVLALA